MSFSMIARISPLETRQNEYRRSIFSEISRQKMRKKIQIKPRTRVEDLVANRPVGRLDVLFYGDIHVEQSCQKVGKDPLLLLVGGMKLVSSVWYFGAIKSIKFARVISSRLREDGADTAMAKKWFQRAVRAASPYSRPNLMPVGLRSTILRRSRSPAR